MSSKNYPVSRKNDLVVQEIKGEVLVYDLNTHKAYCLNQTSALVWELCDGHRSVAEISRELDKKLNLQTGENVVRLALEQLKREGLLENGELLPVDLNGINRREVIRQVGLASLVALPVILAIRAPVAAQSFSACGAVQPSCTCPLIANGTPGRGVAEVCIANALPAQCVPGCEACRYTTIGSNAGLCYPNM